MNSRCPACGAPSAYLAWLERCEACELSGGARAAQATLASALSLCEHALRAPAWGARSIGIAERLVRRLRKHQRHGHLEWLDRRDAEAFLALGNAVPEGYGMEILSWVVANEGTIVEFRGYLLEVLEQYRVAAELSPGWRRERAEARAAAGARCLAEWGNSGILDWLEIDEVLPFLVHDHPEARALGALLVGWCGRRGGEDAAVR